MVLDRVFKGETLIVTRNDQPVGVLVPLELFDRLTAVSVKELAAELHLRVADVMPALTELLKSRPREEVVLSGPAGFGRAGGILLYAEAAHEIHEVLKPAQESQ